MSKNTMIGVFGGVLIALSVFIGDGGLGFAGGATAIVCFLAGVAIIIFLLLKNGVWAKYATIAAATIALIAVIEAVMGGSLSIGTIVLVVGVIFAVIATLAGKRSRK